jgi:hypothetical protein
MRGQRIGLAVVLGLWCSLSVGEAQTWTQFLAGNFESNNFTQFTATSTSDGTIVVTNTCTPPPAQGLYHCKADLAGNGGTNFARVQWDLPSWGQDQLWAAEYSMYLPTGFHSARTCTFQPFGTDTFPTLNNQMRLMVYLTAPQNAFMVLNDEGVTTEITPAFNYLTEGQWVRWRVEQKIHNSAGWTKVYKNGVLVASGTGDTWTGEPVTRIRFGYADCSAQTAPLTLYLDHIVVYTGAE